MKTSYLIFYRFLNFYSKLTLIFSHYKEKRIEQYSFELAHHIKVRKIKHIYQDF